MPKRRRYKKKKKDYQNGIFYLIITIFIILISFVLVSESNGSDIYPFCKELEHLNISGKNDIDLRNELKESCGKELSQGEQELGNLSMEFLKSLYDFNKSWTQNESIAKENARQIDNVYSRIKGMDDNSSRIPDHVEALYRAELGNIDGELRLQRMEIENVTYSIDQLEEKNNSITTELKKIRIEEKARKDEEKNLSLFFSQRKNESNDIQSSLGFSESKYEQVRGNFNERLLPFLLLGIALGGITGIVLSFRWKKEKRYWDAYSSSAKVVSPLKLAVLLTGALVVIFLLYLFLSGKLEAILIASG